MLLNVTDLNVKIKSLKSVLISGGGILILSYSILLHAYPVKNYRLYNFL